MRLQGLSVKDVAAHLGVNVETASEYLNSREGRALFTQARADLMAEIKAERKEHLLEALKTVVAEMSSADQPQVRLRAAQILLQFYGADRPTFPPVDFSSITSIRASLEAVAQSMAEGEMDPQALATLANLSAQLLEKEELEKKIQELTARVDQLESHLSVTTQLALQHFCLKTPPCGRFLHVSRIWAFYE